MVTEDSEAALRHQQPLIMALDGLVALASAFLELLDVEETQCCLGCT